MPETPNYLTIEVEAKEEAKDPFRFIVDGKKFELPHLGIDSVPASLFAVAASQFESDTAQVGAFLQELFAFEPTLGRVLKKLPIAYATEVMKQWTEFSNLDPKASTSSR
jgi:hypothetical protein